MWRKGVSCFNYFHYFFPDLLIETVFDGMNSYSFLGFMILFRCKANKSQPNSLIGWEIVGSQYNNGVYDHVVSNSIISVLTFLNRNASKLKVLFSFLRRQVGDLQRFYYLI